MRTFTAGLVAAFLVAVSGSSSSAASRPTVLGFEWGAGGGARLARYDVLTLRRVDVGEPLGVAGWPWRRSPDGTRLALSSDAPSAPLVVFDLARLRPVALIRPGVANPVGIFWPRADRILVVGFDRKAFRAQIALVDPDSRQVLGRTLMAGRLLAGAAARDGVALLFPSRVVLVDAGLQTRSLALPRTGAAGFAVDVSRDRAWVVATDKPLVAVDLRSGAVTRRPLRIRRLASAAKSFPGITRAALWLGGGRIALTSRLGLSILDVRTGLARVVDEHATWVQRSGDLLVAWTEIDGIGVFDLAGRPRSRVLEGRNVAFFAAAGRRALVHLGTGQPSVVVDLRSGRAVGRASWPGAGAGTFLLGDGSLLAL
jgi:hypothetical protein